MKIALVLLALLAVASPAIAQYHEHAFTKAGDLNAYCASSDPGDIKFCTGYIVAWMDEAQTPHLASDGLMHQGYFADGVTPEQIMRVFTKYIVEHPERENESAFVFLSFSLQQAKLFFVTTYARTAR